MLPLVSYKGNGLLRTDVASIDPALVLNELVACKQNPSGAPLRELMYWAGGLWHGRWRHGDIFQPEGTTVFCSAQRHCAELWTWLIASEDAVRRFIRLYKGERMRAVGFDFRNFEGGIFRVERLRAIGAFRDLNSFLVIERRLHPQSWLVCKCPLPHDDDIEYRDEDDRIEGNDNTDNNANENNGDNVEDNAKYNNDDDNADDDDDNDYNDPLSPEILDLDIDSDSNNTIADDDSKMLDSTTNDESDQSQEGHYESIVELKNTYCPSLPPPSFPNLPAIILTQPSPMVNNRRSEAFNK